MPRNQSKSAAHQHSNRDRDPGVFQQLISVNSTLDWLCQYVVDNLDNKLDTGSPRPTTWRDSDSSQFSSVNTTLDWLCHVVDNMDKKLDTGPPWLTTWRGSDSSHQPSFRPTTNQPEYAADPPPAALLGAKEHNDYARLYNSVAQDGDFVLMPLRDHSNRLVSSFPRTLARLAFIYEDGELFEMLKVFRLKPKGLSDHQTFTEFVGVNFAYVLHAMNTYDFKPVPPVSESRELRERVRASSIRYAVPPSRESIATIERLNTRARTHNRDTVFTLMPIRDTWGLVLPGFPKDLFELFNPVYQKDVRFLLREYGLSDEQEGCERRWVEFVGVPWAWREGWLEDDLVFERYTAV